ncbi:MAG TPA: extracellular solute-binding protein [Ktedonobacteraceae bacterium]|jgi:multiple sugar transport system substrate-binding protein|nr:extracellular solute-binding protein [Ktedonobacteraceae bacterium]
MDATRRDFLKLGTALLATVGAVNLSGCGSGPGAAASGGVIPLQFSFWGSSVRAGRTTQAIQLYQQQHPHTTISTWFSSFGQYWPKLATQISGGSAPDFIQMDMRYIDQYVKKGLLLDLSKYTSGPIDLHDFNQVLLKGSEAEGVVYGVPFGGNFVGIFYDADLLKQAGVAIPAQTPNWTWDTFAEYTLRISKALGPGVYGTEDASSNIGALEIFVRQRGKELFTNAGQRAFSQQDMQDWFGYWDNLRKSGACCTTNLETQYNGSTPALTTLVAGKAAINVSTSNQIQAYQAATTHKLGLCTPPMTAGLRDTGNYLKASMLMSASATTKYPSEVTQFINYLFNNNAAIKALGIERAIPGSARAQALLKPTLKPADLDQLNVTNQVAATSRPKLVLDPPGAGEVGDLLTLIAQGAGFGKMSVAEAARSFVEQTDKALERDGV